MAVLDRAVSIPAATRRQQLSRHMIDPQLSKVLDSSRRYDADGIGTYGTSITHIKSVQVVADEGTVRDCQDGRNSGLIYKSSKKKINRGVQETNIKATLKKGTDGRWRVSRYSILGEGC
ncbi:hypothetical protein ACFQ07_01880 [Actinomadura adrarensis]|uniref:Uncharacterized protein n=1 Tax=Actinomadura adrarensis TaxID=1819600 RepID=A0ABW3C8X2_9ACTN